MKKTITMIAVLLIGHTGFGQQMSATQKYFGGPEDDRLRRITKITDNEFLMVGTMNRDIVGQGYAEMMAIKTSANLSSTQSYRLNSDERDIGEDALVFADGSLGVVGITTNNGATATRDDMVFVRFQEDGSVLTSKSWGNNTVTTTGTEAVVRRAVMDQDNNVVIAGYTHSPTTPMVKKVTPEGFDVWSYQLVQNGLAIFTDIVASENAYYCVGWTEQIGDERNPLLVKLDFTGNLIWSRIYDFTAYNTIVLAEFRTPQVTEDGEIMVSFRCNVEGVHRTGIIKIDDSGSIVWKHQLNFGTDHNNIYGMKPGLNSNEYVCVGNTYSITPDNSDGFLFSFNDTPEGPQTNWIRVFTGSDEDRLFDIETFIDGSNKGYILVGETKSYSNNSFDGWIVRTDQFGGGWENDECWMANLPFSFQNIAMNASDANGSLTAWNIVSNQSLSFDQPIIAPLHNDGLCQPLPLDNSTSINEVTKEAFGLNIYPNPSNGIIQIDTELERFNAELIDLSGRSITRQDFIHQRGTLNVSGICATGTYILRITSGDQWVHQLVQIR